MTKDTRLGFYLGQDSSPSVGADLHAQSEENTQSPQTEEQHLLEPTTPER